MAMATILGRVVTYHEELSPIKSHDPLITWSFEINDKKNHYISTTWVGMANKTGKMVNLPFWALWTCGLAKARDKLKLLHLHYHSAYGHHTWGSPNHKTI